jgi:hypothetical protein
MENRYVNASTVSLDAFTRNTESMKHWMRINE